MRGALREEKTILGPAVDGLLLVHHEERHTIIREEVPQLPSTRQSDPHFSAKFA